MILLVICVDGPRGAAAHARSIPPQINPAFRNKPPGAEQTIRAADGTQDARSRTGWAPTRSAATSTRASSTARERRSSVGIAVAVISVAIGLAIGLVAGYLRWLDAIVMRIMDGLMAIPAILLAIALVSLSSAGDRRSSSSPSSCRRFPRVVRLVRSVVLSIREEPYVEAAIAVGTPTPLLLVRHVLPNTVAPLIVQATYIAASAILIEAILSFLGVGHSAADPDLGQHHGRGPRTLFRVFPHNILFPGIFLALTVLAVNMLGDGLARHARSAHEQATVTRRAAPSSTSRGLDASTAAVPRRRIAPRAGSRDVSFTVNPGEIVCLVGESGSGKSVIAHTTMGLLPEGLAAIAGEILLAGENLLAAGAGAAAQRCAARAWR